MYFISWINSKNANFEKRERIKQKIQPSQQHNREKKNNNFHSIFFNHGTWHVSYQKNKRIHKNGKIYYTNVHFLRIQIHSQPIKINGNEYYMCECFSNGKWVLSIALWPWKRGKKNWLPTLINNFFFFFCTLHHPFALNFSTFDIFAVRVPFFLMMLIIHIFVWATYCSLWVVHYFFFSSFIHVVWLVFFIRFFSLQNNSRYSIVAFFKSWISEFHRKWWKKLPSRHSLHASVYSNFKLRFNSRLKVHLW